MTMQTRLAGMRPSNGAVSIIAIIFACGAAALWLLPRALPTVALQQRASRDVVLARADSCLAVHRRTRADGPTAVRCHGRDSVRWIGELAGGGQAARSAVASGQGITPCV